MLRWMRGMTRWDMIRNENIKELGILRENL